VRGWGNSRGGAAPARAAPSGTPLRSPPWCRCPPAAETGPLAGRAGGGYGGE